ncbi:MAG: hypothetical protein ACRD5B_16305, partial [Nitrososphaeraceae archaeon]
VQESHGWCNDELVLFNPREYGMKHRPLNGNNGGYRMERRHNYVRNRPTRTGRLQRHYHLYLRARIKIRVISEFSESCLLLEFS